MSNIEIRCRVYEEDSKSVDEVVNLYQLRLSEHVLRMADHNLHVMTAG